MSFIYLASPYWHESEVIRLQRVKQVREATATLLSAGRVVYSPIQHNAGLAYLLPATIRHSHEFWMSVDLAILACASALWVLTLDGWKVSRGIQAEVHHAQDLAIPITYINEAYPGELLAHTTDRSNQDLSQPTAPGVRFGSAPATS